MAGSNFSQASPPEPPRPVALITGASRGLGLALARALARRRWALVIDARGGPGLEAAAAELGSTTEIRALQGDVSDGTHRAELVRAAEELGRLDLLVNNASVLGPSPQPGLELYPLDEVERVYRVNALAPIGLIQIALPLLRGSAGRVLNVTSDAAVEGYAGWGGYGSSKAALEQLSNVLAAEHPDLRIYWVDPGDMNTQLLQEAFPDDDLSTWPPPDDSVPGILRLIDEDLPSGRYRARDLVPAPAAQGGEGSAA
jgi:NAD(P)-dependent dehydrogenase (short-subunit alcohol dehydrogenase family)